MSRLFIAAIDITLSAADDIVELIAPSASGLELHEIMLTTDVETDANEVQYKLRLVRYTGSYTSGLGGSTGTGYALKTGGATEDATTVELGNTTPAAIGTGAEEILSEPHFNNRIGFHYLPAPEHRPRCAATDAFVLGLQSAVTSIAFTGHVIYEELIA